jgi:hypothetical protein
MNISVIVRLTMLLIGFYSPNIISAQILNVDREVTDSMNKRWYILLTGSFAKDKQKNNIQDMSLYTESVYKLKNGMALTYVGQIDATLSAKELIQNEGYFHIKWRDLDNRTNSIELFSQYQWNGAWGLQNRSLFGLNFRERILEKNGYDLYFGIGTFYQSEIWNYNGVSDLSKIPMNPVNIIDKQLRINSYIKGAIKITPKCDFVCQTYLQADAMKLMTNPKYRWYWSSELVYNINDNWMFGINYDHTINKKNPVPIDTYYYGYQANLSLKF